LAQRVSTGIVIALISGGVSLVAAGISVANTRTVARLNARLEEQRRQRSKEEQAAELRARYRDPLLNAAFDLQSRLFNIVHKRFLIRYADKDEASRRYAAESTLYVLAEYLGWVEIIRREIQFLDLGDQEANQRWLGALERVRDVLASDDIDAAFRLFRAEQRAIGEIMLMSPQNGDGTPRLLCVGYASFTKRLTDPDFGRWFEKLRADLALLSAEADAHLERAVQLHNALIDVLDLLDPEYKRFARERRTHLDPTDGQPIAQVALDKDGEI
jgi:hypothetical protein